MKQTNGSTKSTLQPGSDFVPCLLSTPFTIVVDTREQRPYSFLDVSSVCGVSTTRAALRSGDYSLAGYEDRIAVERKSIPDLWGSLGKGRARFEREIRRLHELDYAAVVIEGDWSDVLFNSRPAKARMSAKSVYRTVLAWSQRYYRVHWITAMSRSRGEQTTYRVLERWWIDHVDRKWRPIE